jgi:shikimate kinase
MKKDIILVGLMGAGKSTVGKRLAKKLDKKFIDADAEIEKAAMCSISDIFQIYGEDEFRKLEYRVIKRLLNESQDYVISTGEGAFITNDIRQLIEKEKNLISIWLKADVEILLNRTSRTNKRPLLEVDNPKLVLENLLKERENIYKQADICVESDNGHHNKIVDRIIEKLKT